MSSWKKVVCTLHWTINEIDLHRSIMSNFICKWEMESDKGETDSLKPNNQEKLEFNSTYERSITFFINQKDSSIRPKKLKIFLKRQKENNKKHIMGN